MEALQNHSTGRVKRQRRQGAATQDAVAAVAGSVVLAARNAVVSFPNSSTFTTLLLLAGLLNGPLVL